MGKENSQQLESVQEGTQHKYDSTLSIHVSPSSIAPDGYLKSVILVNGQFPGPVIEANWGDYVEGKSSPEAFCEYHTGKH